MIENKFYKVEVKLNNNFRKDFGIEDMNYKQYFYINFVTQEQYCYLHDGTYADNYVFNKNTELKTELDKKHLKEYFVIGLAVNMGEQYKKYFKEGREYAKKHNIPPAKWVQDVERETENNINQNESENDSNDEYIILPTMSNYVIASYERTACNIAFRTHNRGLYKNDVKRAWIQKDEGYTHDNMLTEYKNTWIYYQWTKDDDEISEDEQKGITDNDDDTPIAVLTAGYMNSELRLTIRFIMIGGEIGEPNDVSLMLPFDKNYTENDDLSELNDIITPKLTQLLNYIDDTINE